MTDGADDECADERAADMYRALPWRACTPCGLKGQRSRAWHVVTDSEGLRMFACDYHRLDYPECETLQDFLSTLETRR